VSDRPLRLGPDPNRTYLERWNTMHPNRYGRPDSAADADRGWHQGHANDGTEAGSDSESLPDSLLGAAILVLAPLAGAIATLLIYRWTAPSQLTTGWILGYAGIFLVAAWIGAMLVHALRRLLLAAAIIGATFGIGYLIWSLWLS
jgi:hypothetical protein